MTASSSSMYNSKVLDIIQVTNLKKSVYRFKQSIDLKKKNIDGHVLLKRRECLFPFTFIYYYLFE